MRPTSHSPTPQLIQGYSSYYLLDMYLSRGCAGEWQVLALAVLFALISLGNIVTILLVFLRKIGQRKQGNTHLVTKYRPKVQ